MTEPSTSKLAPPPAATPLLRLPNTIKATGAAVLGAVLFGSEIGYWSQTSNFISFNKVMTGDLNLEPSANELTLLTCTLYLVGTIFALPPVTRIFAGGIGRRKTLILSGFLFAVAMAMQASAAYVAYPASRALLWSGRAVLGIPVAFSITTSPVFLSEIAPPAHRGLIGGMFQFTLMVWLVIASGIGMVINGAYPTSDNAYQYSVWWMLPLGLLVSGTMYMSNETPQFLLLCDQDDDARAVLFNLREGQDEAQTKQEFEAMQVEIEAEKEAMRTKPTPTTTETDTSTSKKTTSLLSGYTLRIVGIVVLTQFLQQFSGQNVLNNFSPKLYEALVSNPNMMSFVGNIVQLVATVPSALLVDRLGRRPLLIFGATFLALAWMVVGLLGILAFHHPEHCYKIVGCPVDAVCDDDARFTSQAMALDYVCGVPPVTVTNTTTSIPSTYSACASAVQVANSDSFNLDCLYSGDDGGPTAAYPYPYIAPAAGYTFIAMAYVVSFVFGLTLGPVIWSYNAEIAPCAYRAQIVGMSAASNLFFNALVVSPIIGDLIAHIGFNTFWIFVVIMLGAIGFFYWIVETKDLPIEVVTELWEAKLHCQYLEHPDPTKIGEENEDDVDNNDDDDVADDVGDDDNPGGDDKGNGDGDDMDNIDKENWA